jgi:putative endonuclease
LYCGITNDIKNRLIEHNSGRGAKYTRSRRPVRLVGVSPEMTKNEALKLEYRIKQLPVVKKLSELTGEENEMTLKQDLKALQKEIKAFEKKMEKLAIAIEKSDKPKSAKKSAAKPAKAKTTKNDQAKKIPEKKKAAKLTAADQVIKIINSSKDGIDAATLVKKTGFDLKKVRNILHRTYKMGKIRRAGKGVYAGA